MVFETKFNLNDRVWTLYKGKADQYPITRIDVVQDRTDSKVRIQYFLNVGTPENYDSTIVNEDVIFETQDELLRYITN